MPSKSRTEELRTLIKQVRDGELTEEDCEIMGLQIE